MLYRISKKNPVLNTVPEPSILEIEKLCNMSSATFSNVFAVLVHLVNIRGAVQRYSERDQK